MKCFLGKIDKASVSQLHNANNERNTNLEEDTKCEHIANSEK